MVLVGDFGGWCWWVELVGGVCGRCWWLNGVGILCEYKEFRNMIFQFFRHVSGVPQGGSTLKKLRDALQGRRVSIFLTLYTKSNMKFIET